MVTDGDPKGLESVALLSWVGQLPPKGILHSPVGVRENWVPRMMGTLYEKEAMGI